ncbi:MAG: formimidoylglutamate deiminase [Paracoccus sp. (in: a-proteobacteria)]|nr:formimidoylglutamate deiminase [Paracoccus sp. (in: a-proteobacteria)]
MIHARQALGPGGWLDNLRVTMDGGRIAALEAGRAPLPGDHRVEALVPGMSNAHSHAFQRGFSGLTEARRAGRESFWSWRELMYRLALSIDPDQMQAIAEMAYVEMLEAGFTRVGEFHYLHHDRDGRPYSDPAELSRRIFAAAANSGIALTHLPVFYAHGGFGPSPAGDGQRRFLCGADAYLGLIEACDAMRVRPQDRVGYAPHSLRAVDTDQLRAIAATLKGRKAHIHVAEQVKEVKDCLAFSTLRPVELLYDTVEVDADWCLIHATHLTQAETALIAGSGAVAGLCPVTEANLGDGLFPAINFMGANGSIAIGTDSNVRIDLAEELRLLEYGQRLVAQERNVLAHPGGSTGGRLFSAALSGGAQALGNGPAELAVGAPADLVALADPLELEMTGAALLDRWIFGRDVSVSDVWAAGAHVVTDGRHVQREAVARRYALALRRALA